MCAYYTDTGQTEYCPLLYEPEFSISLKFALAIRNWFFIVSPPCCGRARLTYHIKQMAAKLVQIPVPESQLNERLLTQFNALSPFDNDAHAQKASLGQSCICGALVQHNCCLLYVNSHAACYHRVFALRLDCNGYPTWCIRYFTMSFIEGLMCTFCSITMPLCCSICLNCKIQLQKCLPHALLQPYTYF